MLGRFAAQRLFSTTFSRNLTPGAVSRTSLQRNRVPEQVDMTGADNRKAREAREMAQYLRYKSALDRGEIIREPKSPKYAPADWFFVLKGFAILFGTAGGIFLAFKPDAVPEDLSRIGTSNQAREAMAYVLQNPQMAFPVGRTQSGYASYTGAAANSNFNANSAVGANNPFPTDESSLLSQQQQFFSNPSVYPNAAAAGSKKAKNAAAAAPAASE